MDDRQIPVPEVEGKTIRSMSLMLSSTGETEVHIDFTDGTSFSSTTCQHLELDAELYIGGSGEPQVLRKYGS